MKKPILTNGAPAPIGCYSQAVQVQAAQWVFLSGQIGINPQTNELVPGIEAQIHQVFHNLQQVAIAAGAGGLENILKFNVYLTSLENFPLLNQIMTHYVPPPYPARAVVEVRRLPKDAEIEIDAIMML